MKRSLAIVDSSAEMSAAKRPRFDDKTASSSTSTQSPRNGQQVSNCRCSPLSKFALAHANLILAAKRRNSFRFRCCPCAKLLAHFVHCNNLQGPLLCRLPVLCPLPFFLLYNHNHVSTHLGSS